MTGISIGVVAVFSDKQLNPCGVTNGGTSGIAVLEDKETCFTILVEHSGTVQLSFIDNTLKLQESTRWMFEECACLGVRVQLYCKVEGWDTHSWV